MTSPSPSAAIAAGGDHSIALRVDGAVRDWGADSFGELGTGRLVFASSAQPIPGVPSMMAVSAGDLHSAAVASDGTVWTWGRNSEGQLGNGSTNDQTIPAQVAGLTGFVAIAAGYRHTLALRSDGTVWAWGANAFGQLGDNTTSQRARPVQIPGLSGVTAIAAGHEHSIAIRSGGNVWGWGRNQYGQLCNGSYSDSQAPVQASGLTGVTAVSTSLDHTMVLKGDATVWACGNGGYGVLGNGNPSPSANPVQATGLSGMIAVSAGQVHSMALRNDGTVWTWGNNTFGELGDASTTDRPTPVPVSGLTGVIAIAAGNGFSLALKGDGTVRAWGYDTYGQLGDGATANASTPVAVLGLTGATSIAGGGGHALVGKSDGTLRTWGYNGYGQLGLGGTTSRSTPTLPSGLSGIVAIAAGRFHTLALKDDGTVRGWGDNENGQLGDGTRVLRSAPVAVTGLTGIVAIAGGERFSLALKSDGTVWAWGNNQSGQLGNGTTSGFPGRADAQAVSGLSGVIAIAAGDNHAAAVKGDGTVWTWGYNGYGQLGDGSGTDRSAPVQVSGLSGVTMVSAGMNYTIARKGDGTAWAWGWNGFGQLGDGTTFNRSTPVPVSGLSGVVAVAAGGNVDTAYTVHTAALKSDGTVWTWGSNSSGQLGDGSTTSRSVPGPVSGLTGMTAVAVGHAHTLALKGDGTVLSWGAALGQNGSGQLGDGAFVARSRPVVVVAENGAGNLDANNWYLDLAPAISKSIPAALTPKVLAVAQFSDAGTLTATVKYKISELGTSVNNYVLALVPPSFLHPPSTASPDVEAKAGGLILAQLTPQGWTAVVGPLDAHSQGTATGAGGAANILSGVPLSSLPAGTKFCIGYGTSALAMLSAQSLKEVFAVGVADASATPCVLFGLYIEGPAASTSGATVTFKASVVGASPTGTVQFKDGSTGLSAPVVVVAANPAVSTASIATSSLSVGVHSIGAAYSGDAQNSAANVSPLQHTVSAGSASSVQLSGPASSQAGNEVAFSVTVVGNNPTGSVQFKDWGGDLGPVATLVGGETTLRISTLAAGSHSITAVYFGDGNNAGSTSNSVTHTVYATAVTQVTLSSSANPSTANVQVTLTAAVTGASPTGSIVFRDAGASLGIVPLSTGKASLVIAFAAPGVHALTAEYSGDLNNQGATSATLFQQVVAPVTKLASSTQLSSSSNPSTLAQSVAFSATVSGSAATPAGSVAFRDGAALIPGCAAVTLTAGVGACNTSVLGTGPHSVTATYSGNATYEGSTSLALTQSVNAGASLLSANPAALDFGGQSINTTSPALTTTITNVTGGSITVAALTLPSGFTLSSNTCGTVAAGGSCVIGLTFTPTLEGSTAGILGIVYAGGGPTGVSLAGIGERSLVTHYYRSILRRAPDAPGKAFWESEAVRLQSIGANVNEAWFAMASFFYFSGEYASFNRDNIGFVTDLYNTFFNRTPDGGGLSFWSGLMTSGMPREVVLASFEFSSEFAAFTQAIFGNTAARAEVDVVGDFYRGLLARLPDQGGFDFWVQKFRTAQCTGGGGAAGAVYTQVESISSSFANSGEYAGKNRTNSQYVGDLYNSFLRRGGDLNGVQFWINQLNTAAMTREQVRQQFIASSEFQGRVTNVINQGCIN